MRASIPASSGRWPARLGGHLGRRRVRRHHVCVRVQRFSGPRPDRHDHRTRPAVRHADRAVVHDAFRRKASRTLVLVAAAGATPARQHHAAALWPAPRGSSAAAVGGRRPGGDTPITISRKSIPRLTRADEPTPCRTQAMVGTVQLWERRPNAGPHGKLWRAITRRGWVNSSGSSRPRSTATVPARSMPMPSTRRSTTITGRLVSYGSSVGPVAGNAQRNDRSHHRSDDH